MDVIHSGIDGLKFTIQTDISAELRACLVEAKDRAIKNNKDTVIERGGIAFAVCRTGGSAFVVHTGDYGAKWYLLDPGNRPANNPGVTVDFRAFLLATGGLQAAQAHFESCMAALDIPYVETQLRVSRVDFAIDILAPWFEPDRGALVIPQGTRISEHAEPDVSVTRSTGARVTGLRAGAPANRQLVIYDKRAEVISSGKMGWLTIWNDTLAEINKTPIDLKDRDQSQVWRFELRMGSKQLRNRWEMRSWFDLDAMIGDAFSDFVKRVRYCEPTTDSNRSRWPLHPLWRVVEGVVESALSEMRSGVVPADVKTANREEHKRMLDMQTLGLMISRAATEGVAEDDIEGFFMRHVLALKALSRAHPTPIEERLASAEARCQFR